MDFEIVEQVFPLRFGPESRQFFPMLLQGVYLDEGPIRHVLAGRLQRPKSFELRVERVQELLDSVAFSGGEIILKVPVVEKKCSQLVDLFHPNARTEKLLENSCSAIHLSGEPLLPGAVAQEVGAQFVQDLKIRLHTSLDGPLAQQAGTERVNGCDLRPLYVRQGLAYPLPTFSLKPAELSLKLEAEPDL
jgi:hypothetical protein